MTAKLTVLTDLHQGQAATLEPGQTLTVGRLKRNNALHVPDRLLAPTHFAIEHTEGEVRLRDLSQGVQKHARCASSCFLADLRNAPCPNGTCGIHDHSVDLGLYVNKVRVREAVLKDGDAIVAGTSCFLFTTGDTPAAAPPPSEPPAELALTREGQDRFLAYLAQSSAPLYAIVDAARHPAALQTLLAHENLHYSLYDGTGGTDLDEIAPYLVELPFGSPLLEALVREYWGRSIYSLLVAPVEFKLLRRHLRRFLMVRDEQGKQMYFRYYDPRVLRVYLPTCTSAECKDFFGPIHSFVVEAETKGTTWQFMLERSGTLRKDLFQV